MKKFLELPTDEEGKPTAYPAVQFTLDRRYTTSDGTLSEWEEDVRTMIWTSEEVEAAYGDGSGGTLLEHIFLFEDLDLYAPNGSLWKYRVREATDDWMGGFTVTSAAGDVSDPNAITGESNTVEGLGLTPDEEGGSTAGTVTAAATFYNRPAADRAAIVLQGTKIWEDFDNAFSTRPEELAITVSRYAPSQPEQNNGIDLEEVSPDLYEIRWNKPSGSSTWSYTITGKAGTVGLEQFAPNGMRWVYRIEETIPSRYTSPSDGEAWASREPLQDNVYIVDPLTNTVARTVSYQKQWINSDGNAVSEDYLGVDLTVQFLLQVREEGHPAAHGQTPKPSSAPLWATQNTTGSLPAITSPRPSPAASTTPAAGAADWKTCLSSSCGAHRRSPSPTALWKPESAGAPALMKQSASASPKTPTAAGAMSLRAAHCSLRDRPPAPCLPAAAPL